MGGWLIDHLIMRGHDETRVRKTVLVTGMLFGLSWLVYSVAYRAEGRHRHDRRHHELCQ